MVTANSYSTMHYLKVFNNSRKGFRVRADNEFPPFLPKEIHQIKDPLARNLAMRIQRLPVQVIFFPLLFLLGF